jgi:hypothetical protein
MSMTLAAPCRRDAETDVETETNCSWTYLMGNCASSFPSSVSLPPASLLLANSCCCTCTSRSICSFCFRDLLEEEEEEVEAAAARKIDGS